jgi:hypothetical protein
MYESITYITNPLEKTFMKIAFVPSTNLAGTTYFKLNFPLFDQEYRDLYLEDLGTGLKSGDAIYCFLRTGFAATVGITCTFY